MIGGFSSAVDLVQSQYGWSDRAVLDLPVCRLRQITANIEFRRKNERLHRNTITEWQTRTLASFIAATVDTQGKRNPLAEEADKIRLRVEDKKGKADSDVPMEVFLEQGSQVAENPAGSFERLARGFQGK